MSEQDHQFNANKIMVTLFILTTLEVIWGAWLIPYTWKFALWGGLLIFAFWKGILIFMYFMHMKFEGWICKCLIVPTPFMVMIIYFALLPDVSLNDRLIHDVGDQLDPVDGLLDSRHGHRWIENDPVHRALVVA